MRADTELLPDPSDLGLPFPPAVTRRVAVSGAVDDDVMLIPPFSPRAARPPLVAAAVTAVFGEDPTAATPLADPKRALADDVAGLLEGMAAQLRRGGLHALLQSRPHDEPIDAVLAAVIAGYLARR